ncbi:DNA internalization-related competence protein ComEC/Rec2 [Desulfatiferula olefinivorans]
MPFLFTDYYKRPVIPLLAGYAAGLFIGRTFSPPAWLLTACILLCLIRIVWAVCRSLSLRITPILLFVALGVPAMHVASQREVRPDHPLYYADQGILQIRGKVVTSPEKDGGRQKCLLEADGIALPERPMVSVSGRIRLTVAGEEPDLTTGQRLIVESRLKPFRNFYNPGGFDYERYMAAQDIWASCYARGDRVRLLSSDGPGPIARLRRSFEMFIDREVASVSSRQVLKTLLVGNRKALDPALKEAFNRTGTAHLLAISGLHVGIVAGLAFGLCYLFFSRIPSVLWAARARRYAGLLALGPVLAYGVLSGMAPSTQRALLMVAVVLLTHSLDAEHDVLNALALAALSILAVSPLSLFGASFQLSFTAVFFIVWGMMCLSAETRQEGGGFFRNGKIKTYVLVSLLAGAGTLPLVAASFNRISVIGPVANPVLVPLVTLLVVPLGIGALFVYPWCSLLAIPLIRLAGMILDGVLSLIRTLAALPWASVNVVGLSFLEMACIYGLMMSGLLLVRARREKRPGFAKNVWVVIAVLLVIGAGDIAYWVYRRNFNDDLRITMMDVGQGSAALAELPGGACMLFDGGGFAGYSSFDMGEQVLAPFLWSKKITTVDRVVLSHPESDHMNGLLFILEHFSVGEFWFNGPWRPTKSCGRLKEIVERRGIPLRTVQDISEVVDINGVAVRVLWPEAERFSDGDRGDINDASLVVSMAYQGVGFLFPGDITERAEQAMVSRYGNDLSSRVLCVPHHGSKTSSSDAFLDAVSPEYALISAGYRNRFAMPHQSVLRRLERRNLAVYRTDHHGALILTVKNGAMTLTPFLEHHDGAER